MKLIQRELHRVALDWNVHRIPPSTNLESPSGIPDSLYFLPELTGAQNYSIPVDEDEIEMAEGMCAKRPQEKGCCSQFKQLAEMIMADEVLDTPTTADEARRLYFQLLELIDDL